MIELTTKEKIMLVFDHKQKRSNMPLQPNWHIIDGKWSHLLTVRDGSNCTTYQDGELVGEKSCSEIGNK